MNDFDFGKSNPKTGARARPARGRGLDPPIRREAPPHRTQEPVGRHAERSVTKQAAKARRGAAGCRGAWAAGARNSAVGWLAGRCGTAVSVSVRSSPRCRRRFSWPPHADKLRSVTLLQRALPRGLPRGPRSATLLLPMTAALDHACVQRGPRTALSVPAALAASFFILFFSSRVSSL
jgi:hypothetical protein